MPTIKQRINLAVDEETYQQIKVLADRNKSRVTTISNELLKEALELREDLYLSSESDLIIEKDSPRISHDDVWGESE